MAAPGLMGILMLATGLLCTVAAAAEPGRLVWEATFDDGAVPAGWKVVRGELLAFVPTPEGGPGADGNLAATNSGAPRSVLIHIPATHPHFRLEWRVWVDPAKPDAPLGTVNFNDENWWFNTPALTNRIMLRSMTDIAYDRSVRTQDAAFVPEPPAEAGWRTFAVEKVGREVTLELAGRRTTVGPVLPASALDDDDFEISMHIGKGAIVDDVRLYDLVGRVEKNPGGLRIGYYPSLNKLLYAIFSNKPGDSDARITVSNGSGSVLIDEQVPVHRGTMIAKTVWDPELKTLDLPDLRDGRYAVTAYLRGPRGDWRKIDEQMIERKHFPWEGNNLGITDEVLPPFEPIVAEGQNVNVVLRKYQLTGLGLIEQVQAKGQDADEDYEALLASPVELVANGKAMQGQGKLISQAPNKVMYEGRSQHAAVSATVRNTIEEDGCMRIELTLEPGAGGQKLDSLTLDIPIKDEMAPLWHLGTRRLRANPAGATPTGTGVVWDGSKFKEPDFTGNFHPYLWFGAEARGICWFADNDRGWELDLGDGTEEGKASPSQELIRKDGVLTLRIHLVQKPVTLTDAAPGSEPRTIVFGLMATPAKPMPEGWRSIGRRDGQRIGFSMPTLFGMPSAYGGKYPMGGDFSTFDFIRDNRTGVNTADGVNFNERQAKFIDAWVERNLDRPEMNDATRDSFRSRLDTGLSRYRNEGASTLLTVYFDEFHGTSLFHDEVPVYWSEWNGSDQWLPASGRWRNVLYGEPGEDWEWHPQWSWNWRIRSDTLPRSYQDFTCWYGAEWLKRGFGLYFDNTFPRYNYDPITTTAYYLPNGHIQPSAGMWSHRAYLRRIWTLHQQIQTPETPHVMMLHMTNTHIAPYMVWNESNLDLEWKMRADRMFQDKFSPELLRAETIGRQTGNIPVAMGTISPPHVTPEWYEEVKDDYNRARQMGLLVHEIKSGISTQLYPKVVDEFGYGLDDCKVVNYWDDNPPLTVSDEKCKWLLLHRNTPEGSEAMIVLCTWNPEDGDVTLQLDAGALGVSLKEAVDAESGEAIAIKGDRITVAVDGFGARIIRVK